MGRNIERPASVRKLEALYQRHHRRVRWVLRSQGIAEHDLDDAVHDVFLAIHRRHDTRDPGVAEDLWVTGVARNVAFSQRRSHARRQRALDGIPEPAPHRGPDEDLDRRDAWRRLEAFLGTLADEQREVFVLMEVLGMATTEAAAITGAPANTVSSRLRLARRRFDRSFACDPAPLLRSAIAGERPSEAEQRGVWARIVVALPLGSAAAPPVAVPVGVVVAKWATAIAALVIVGIGVKVAVTAEAPPRPEATTVAAAPIEDATPRRRAEGSPPGPTTETPSPSLAQAMPETRTNAPAPVRPPRGVLPRAAEDRSRRPDAPAVVEAPATNDELGEVLTRLRDAESRLEADDPAAALAIVDALPSHTDRGPLHRDRVRIEQRAACALGRIDRAAAARDELVRLGLAVDRESACP